MSKEDKNFFYNPTKTQLILWTVIWFIGTLLVVLADTDFFTQYPSYNDGILFGLPLSVIGFTVVIIILYWNYFSSSDRFEPNEQA